MIQPVSFCTLDEITHWVQSLTCADEERFLQKSRKSVPKPKNEKSSENDYSVTDKDRRRSSFFSCLKTLQFVKYPTLMIGPGVFN